MFTTRCHCGNTIFAFDLALHINIFSNSFFVIIDISNFIYRFYFFMCSVSIIPFSLMFNVAGPVLYLGLKVIQLSSGFLNVMK